MCPSLATSPSTPPPIPRLCHAGVGLPFRGRAPVSVPDAATWNRGGPLWRSVQSQAASGAQRPLQGRAGFSWLLSGCLLLLHPPPPGVAFRRGACSEGGVGGLPSLVTHAQPAEPSPLPEVPLWWWMSLGHPGCLKGEVPPAKGGASCSAKLAHAITSILLSVIIVCRVLGSRRCARRPKELCISRGGAGIQRQFACRR